MLQLVFIRAKEVDVKIATSERPAKPQNKLHRGSGICSPGQSNPVGTGLISDRDAEVMVKLV